jgi:hypothetical protein
VVISLISRIWWTTRGVYVINLKLYEKANILKSYKSAESQDFEKMWEAVS